MFSFPFIKGDPKTAFSEPYSIVMTEEMAAHAESIAETDVPDKLKATTF